MRAPQWPVSNQWEIQNRQPSVLYVFEHKTKNILIHAPHTHIVAFWYISKYPKDFIVKFVIIPQYFIKQQYLWNIAIQRAVGCSAYKLIYVVRVLNAREKIIVKQDY